MRPGLEVMVVAAAVAGDVEVEAMVVVDTEVAAEVEVVDTVRIGFRLIFLKNTWYTGRYEK